MPNPVIEEFAKTLVRQIRDEAIRSSDRSLRRQAADPVANRWRDVFRDGNLEKAADALIPDVVDDTIFYLLRAIDQGLLQLTFTASNGESTSLSRDGMGELGGWYMGSPGWREMYSEERFNDDLADLR
jgi:hypothetical protein